MTEQSKHLEPYMAKNDKKKGETVPPAAASAVEPQTPPATSPAVTSTTETEGSAMPTEKTEKTAENGNTSTALVPVASAAVAVVDDSENRVAQNKALAARLPPRYREDVLFLNRPSPEALFKIVEGLSGDAQTRMMELIRKTRPKKQGAHTTREGFSPTQIRVNQGTGNDPARPAKHPPGNFYTTDSRDLGDEIKGIVLLYCEGRTMWPPQDQKDANASKAPLCTSLDRLVGSRYGECSSCPNAQKKYNEGGCGREVTVWIIDQALTGIYEIKFAKSSVGSGESLAKVATKSDNLWDRVYSFKNEERSEDKFRWFVTKGTPLSDPKDANAGNSDKSLHPLFEALSKLLDADVFYPQLADIYDRSKNSTDTASAAEVGANEAALLGNSAGDSKTPDYSGSGNPDL